MGKIRTRIIGDESMEKKQKEQAKKKADEKKVKAKASLDKKEEKQAKATAEKAKDEKSTDKPEKKIAKPLKDKEKKQVSRKKRGKKYKEAKLLVDKTKTYTVEEAVELLKKMKISKIDESVELHLNVDETGLKGEVDLPHSTGKIVKVAVVNDEVLSNIEKGKFDFDILVTHPSFMPKLAKFARVLGPKGLMPNPKAGTISPNPEEVVKKFAKGILRWKTEPKFPLIHQMIGKISFETKSLNENTKKFIAAVGKPHIKRAFIKSTMSPSVRIDIERL